MPVQPTLFLDFNSYPECLHFLEALDVSVMKLGTERIRQVLKVLGDPQDQVSAIHIVGTNGKGSTSALLASMYQAAGYQTGLFTSPHLIDVRERIQIGITPVSEDLFVDTARQTLAAMRIALPDRRDWLTYFEFLNTMAFLAFSQAPVDIAIIEAGLGGRLDSTNVMKAPLAVVTTPISLDHVERLGPTLVHIAREKAGVFKPNVPVFTGFQTPEVLETLRAIAQRQNCPLHTVPESRFRSGPLSITQQGVHRTIQDQTSGSVLFSGLPGHYQARNLTLAVSVVEALQSSFPVPDSALINGIRSATWPGRYQYLPQHQLLIDGSHNQAGLDTLLESIRSDFPDTPIHWGLSLLNNRSPNLLVPLAMHPGTVSVSLVHSGDPERFHSPSTLSGSLQELVPSDKLLTHETVARFLDRPVPPNALKVLTGSLYTTGEALQLLG